MRMNLGHLEGPASDLLRAHVKRGLLLALARFGDRIERAQVRFDMPNGVNRCRISVGLRGPSVKALGLDRDPFSAVNRALSRVASSVGRALDREPSQGADDSLRLPLVPVPKARRRRSKRPGTR